jgi:hypothetical protein
MADARYRSPRRGATDRHPLARLHELREIWVDPEGYGRCIAQKRELPQMKSTPRLRAGRVRNPSLLVRRNLRNGSNSASSTTIG